MSTTPGSRSSEGHSSPLLFLASSSSKRAESGVDRNECLDDVGDDVDRFAVAEVALPRGVSIE
jgi:hypothetical protein